MTDNDWSKLKPLRQAFLEAEGHLPDYWKDPSLLAAYDRTFAQRIAWKWEAVLQGLPEGDWSVPLLVDWGCGSGIATRTALKSGRIQAKQVLFYDRSEQALQFAAQRLVDEHPGVPWATTRRLNEKQQGFGLLVSHVLSEVSGAALEELIELCIRAAWVIWVEAGRLQESRKLSEIRERLRSRHSILAPCPHQGPCGMLQAGQEGNWCHFFASPPGEVFRSAFWRTTSQELGIDLRSLPLSYLVASSWQPSSSVDGQTVQVLGRARTYKGHCRWTGCTTEGIFERDHQKRYSRELFVKLGEPGLYTRLDASTLLPRETKQVHGEDRNEQ